MARNGWILGAALLFAGTLAAADELDDSGMLPVPYEATDPMSGPAGASSGPGDSGRLVMNLSLSEAIALAIENNLSVQVDRHDPLIAWERTRVAWGAYDPVAKADATWATIETPIASFLQASPRIEDETISSGVGLSGLLPVTSTQYDISFRGDRLKTDRTISLLREQWESGVTFSVTQPLLRGLYWNEPWKEVKISKQAYGEALENFRTRLMEVVLAVEGSYWDTVATEEQAGVAQKSLEAALKLLEQTEIQYEVGVVSKVEVFEAEAGVAEREFDLIEARNRRENTQDLLIDRILGTNLRPGSDFEIHPIDRPGDYTAYAVDVEEATRKALVRRPELAALDDRIRQQEIELTFSRNQMAPQLDLVASYGYKGLSGKPCDPTVAPVGFAACSPAASQFVGRTIDDSFRSSLEDYFDHDGAVNWAIGGVFSIPLGNHAPRARKRQAQLQMQRIRSERTRLVQDIILKVRIAARTLLSAQERIQASERRRLAAEEQFRAEGIRLEQGESTPFNVLERERELVSAESQKIGAFELYRDAVTALERQQGTILERHNIVVDQARRLR